jgi:hypothetical protein
MTQISLLFSEKSEKYLTKLGAPNYISGNAKAKK